MTAGGWGARGAAGVAKAPEAVQHNVLQRLSGEACLLAQQLLQPVRLVLVVERVVLKHGQCGLVHFVGDHYCAEGIPAGAAAWWVGGCAVPGGRASKGKERRVSG